MENVGTGEGLTGFTRAGHSPPIRVPPYQGGATFFRDAAACRLIEAALPCPALAGMLPPLVSGLRRRNQVGFPGLRDLFRLHG